MTLASCLAEPCYHSVDQQSSCIGAAQTYMAGTSQLVVTIADAIGSLICSPTFLWSRLVQVLTACHSDSAA